MKTKGRPRKKRLASATEKYSYKRIRLEHGKVTQARDLARDGEPDHGEPDHGEPDHGDTNPGARNLRRCGKCGGRGHYSKTCKKQVRRDADSD